MTVAHITLSRRSPAPEATLAPEIAQLQATIATRLQRAGVVLPDVALVEATEAILVEAVRIAAQWVEAR